MGQKKVLLFHISGKKQNQIKKLCSLLGIAAVSVDESRHGEQIGVLAGITGFKGKTDSNSKTVSAEMLVFSGMDSEEMDRFLSEYKKNGIEPVALKAVVTPDNIFWTAEQLFRELMMECCHYKKQDF